MTPAALNRLAEVAAKCAYAPWQIEVRCGHFRGFSSVNLEDRHTDVYLQVRDENGKCNVTGTVKPWGGRKWRLSEHMTDTEIVKTALNAVIAAQMHETLEQFKYRGVAIFDPHIGVDDLLRLRWENQLDGRPDPVTKVVAAGGC